MNRRAVQLLWIACLIGFGSAGFRFLGPKEKANPTPGKPVTLQWEAKDVTLRTGTLWWQGHTNPVYDLEPISATPSPWNCNTWNVWGCVHPETSTVPNTVFSGVVNIPPDKILATINTGAWLDSYTNWDGQRTKVDGVWTSSSSFTTGNAEYDITPSLVADESQRVVPGLSVSFQFRLSNDGPSVARNARCNVVVGVEGTADWLVAPSGCTPTADANVWSCTKSGDIGTSGSATTVSNWELAVPPYYRGNISILVEECSAQGSATSPPPSVSGLITLGTPSWNLSTSFAEEDKPQQISLERTIDITSFIYNNGLASSLSTSCTWDFSVSSLSFVSSNIESCSSSYPSSNGNNLQVRCALDVPPPNGTIAIVSISAKPELAGTSSFDVVMQCKDERGDGIPSTGKSFIVVEELEDVNVAFSLVTGKVTTQKRSTLDGFTKEDLGETSNGELLFDEALLFSFNATSQGALYARNVTCDVILSGRDAPLLASSSLSECEDMGTLPSGIRLVRCFLAELRAEVVSTKSFVMLPDPRLAEFDIAVECNTDLLNSIVNPVFQRSYNLLYVDYQTDGSSEQKESSSSDNNNGLGLGLGLGIGLPFLLVIAVVLVVILLWRRKGRKLRQRERDMTSAVSSIYASETSKGSAYKRPMHEVDEEMRVSKAAASNQSFQWEIPFSELEFEEEIGNGCFGTVWRGAWRETTVAIKMFNSIKDSETAKTNFKAECDIMKHLRPHTNVIQLFGVSMEEGTPWCMVMEFLAQGNLLHFLQNSFAKKKKDERRRIAVKMAREIAAGMHHLHSEDIIHRDLAARNVLLTGDLTIKVAGLHSLLF
ncbi:non-specific protein-tyrosine kinase [Balamuthia mandrillaris]